MKHVKHVHVIENVLKLNDEIAADNRRLLHLHGVYCLNLIGAPGCGKTALLEETLRQLHDEMIIGVAVGDLATTRDADRLAKWADHVVQINTGKSCHLEAHQIRRAMGMMPLDQLDLLVIENVGNLICPVGFDLGENVKVGMFSVSEGDDKAAKHPTLVHAANLLLLNKIDLLEHMDFDMPQFEDDARQINPDVQLMRVSATRGALKPWLTWLRKHVAPAHRMTSKH